MKLLAKIFGTRNDKILKQIQPIINRINDLEPSLKPLSDSELAAKTTAFRTRVDNGESLDALLPEAYAVCREGARRTLGQRHYDVQLIGGVVLHQGKIAEMKTGEGKTLTATLPCYLHGLAGQGAHVVTVNDYLARRDSEWMGQVHQALGLRTGVIGHGLSDRERREAYASDITYGTNNEFGFDYLRDNMKTDPGSLVQRGHSFAIVDEVDSILIDEARTPLIISGPADSNLALYSIVNAAIPGLQKDSDYIVDEKSRSVTLTEDGISKLEKRLRLDNLYDPKHIEYLHHCQQALKAHVIFKKDVDYVVRNNEVLIIDEFTGRLMPGRRYSDGLHGALEAKENVEVQQETQTMATITFQNYFRLYKTLSGMTGTADTEAVEFKKIYNLDVVVIPTNQSVRRVDEEDVIYRTALEKFNAIADEIHGAQKRGQPVLVGTVSVEKSELLSNLLQKRQVAHSVLNAKNHAGEATIVAEAGEKGRVTIATNMAGRGTDIRLGDGVRELGGLYVIGTERHESRRIDNQLRGRSGRQGDPGRSKFFLSFEDDLMRIFASERVSAIMSRLGMEEGEAIFAPMVTRTIEKAQSRVEEQNFSSRKYVLEYDDVMSQQRQVIYGKRSQALQGSFHVDFLEQTIESMVISIADRHAPENLNTDAWNFSEVAEDLRKQFNFNVDFSALDPVESSYEMLAKEAAAQIVADYYKKFSNIDSVIRQKIENYIYLQIIDQAWKEHLLSMDALKDAVSLRGYGQRDPLQEYKREAFNLFSTMMDRIDSDCTLALLHMPKPEQNLTEEQDISISSDSVRKTAYDMKRKTSQVPDDSQLVYHGSGEAMQDQAARRPSAGKEDRKVGRNSLCPCGSGKKFKRCHGKPGAEDTLS